MKCSQFKIKWTPEQLKRGVVSPESNGRQKEIQVFIENLFKQDEIQWLHVDRQISYACGSKHGLFS
jgi:hypothetical protein